MTKYNLRNSKGYIDEEFDTIEKALNFVVKMSKNKNFEYVEIEEICDTTLFDEIMKVYPKIEGTSSSKFDEIGNYISNQVGEFVAKHYFRRKSEILPIIEDVEKLKEIEILKMRIYIIKENYYFFANYNSVLKFRRGRTRK